MDASVGAFLVRKSDPEYIHRNKSSNQKAAIIVETRRAFFLEPVIRTTMKALGADWNLHVFHSTQNGAYLKQQLRGWDVSFRQLGLVDLKPEQYNSLLTLRTFWESFQEPQLLVFQLDTILFCPPPESVWQYGMVGAPCGVDTLNGGLSTRLKSAMLDVLEREKRLPFENEDVYYTRVLRVHWPHLVPHVTFAASMFVESIYLKGTKPVGAHGTDKPYLSCDTWDLLVSLWANHFI